VHGQEYVIDAPTTKDLGINGNSSIFKKLLEESRRQSKMSKMLSDQNMLIEKQANEIRELRKINDDHTAYLDEIAEKVA